MAFGKRIEVPIKKSGISKQRSIAINLRIIHPFFVIIAFFLFLSTIGIVDANTLYVPEDYQTIRSAINAASNGDSIVVHSGIYHENIVINKKLSLIGKGFPIIYADSEQAVVIVSANNVIIRGFKIINSNSIGILVKSNGITLSDLDISDTNVSINLLKSQDSVIKNNTIKKQIVDRKNYGIYLLNSPRNMILNNYLENIGEGIYLDSSSGSTISNNILKNSSLRVIESYNNVVEKNLVNDKPLVYLENQNGGIITDAGQVILIKSDGITIKDNSIHDISTAIFLFKSNNVLIINNTILRGTWGAEPHEYGDGILLKYSSAIIKNNDFIDNWEGIQLSYSYENEISDNTFTNNNVGILISNSSRNKVINNRFTYCGIDVEHSYENEVIGNFVNDKPLVYLENKRNMEVTNSGQIILVNSQRISVKNNNISRTTVGIKLWNSSDNFIMNNILLENTWGGISLLYSHNNSIINNIVNKNDDGIHLAYSFKNIIKNNTVNNSRLFGTSLLFSARNEISHNFVNDSGLFGISLRSSSNNFVYFNDFMNNHINVVSDPSKNSWNSSKDITYIYNNKLFTSPVGNYFSDYTSSDIDYNGIGDTPYRTSINNFDYYPRIKPLDFYSLLNDGK